MKQSTCSAVICQPGGCKQKYNIGTQFGTTASDRTVQVPVIVNQTQNSANPTQQLVVGSRPSRPSKYTKTLTGKVFKTVKVETVRKMTPPMPTTSGDRDCCSRPYWLCWVCANLQCSKAEHWAVNCETVNFNKLWKTVKINIFEELTFFISKCHFEDFEENLIFDSKTLICKNCDFSCCYFECLFFKFQEISGNWFSGMLYLLYWGNCNYQEKWASMLI